MPLLRASPLMGGPNREPARVVSELVDRVGHPLEKIEAMRASLHALQRAGAAQIEDQSRPRRVSRSSS